VLEEVAAEGADVHDNITGADVALEEVLTEYPPHGVFGRSIGVRKPCSVYRIEFHGLINARDVFCVIECRTLATPAGPEGIS
jgi:hypothetical protein